MRISVIVTTYNGATYIEEQLDSIREQTRRAEEVLICDDCSTDNTFILVSEYIKKYRLEGWKAVRNENNLGWKRNFIECIGKTAGECFFFCDQDDVWDAEKIEIMSKYMELHPDINVLTCKYTDFDERGVHKERPEILPEMLNKQKFNPDFLKILYPGCTYCVRRTFADNVLHYWREELPHDAFFWRTGLASDSLYTVNCSLIMYRRHSDSTFSVENKERRTKEKRLEWIAYAKRIIEDLKIYIDDFGVNSEQKRDYIYGAEKWLDLRENLLKNHSILSGFKLALYNDKYISFKQYLGDWAAAFHA